MKILVDPEVFFYGVCGLVRYYATLCQQLEQRGHTVHVPLVLSGSDFIRGRMQSLERLTTKQGPLFERISKRLTWRANRYSKKWYFRELAQGDYDLVLITAPIFEDEFLRHMPPSKPFVMVVHDTMRCVLGPDGLYDAVGPAADRLAFLSRRAARVFCISHATQRDLLKLARLDAERTRVIHTGNLMNTTMQSVAPAELPAEYLLFVGERTGRKNFRAFIQAVQPLLQERPSLHVVCTGRPTPWEEDLLEALGVRGQVTFVPAPDATLLHLYRTAKALVYPSLYEGFGLPVLEAMALGCPVVTSTCGALQEVGRDAVVYVDPYDEASIRSGVLTILDDTARAQALRDRGVEVAREFTATAMMDAFERGFREAAEGLAMGAVEEPV